MKIIRNTDTKTTGKVATEKPSKINFVWILNLKDGVNHENKHNKRQTSADREKQRKNYKKRIK